MSITNAKELQAKIIELQTRRNEEGVNLKAELSDIIDNIHPVRLFINGLKKIVTSPEVKTELLSVSIAMGAGYLAKKIIVGNSKNTLQKITGNILSLMVSQNITLNSEKIQSTVFSFIKELINKKKSTEETNNKAT
jgi:hypothetical protein